MMPDVLNTDTLKQQELGDVGQIEAAPTQVFHKPTGSTQLRAVSEDLVWRGFTPEEVLDLYRFSPYLIPVIPPGRPLKKGEISEGKEPNWDVIEHQRGTKSQKTYLRKPPSAEEVLEWPEIDPETNIGLPTGREPGRVALDVDGPLPGCWDLLDLPDTPTTSSGRTEGGRHIHFATSSSLTTTEEVVLPCNGTKLQLIGEGSHVVAPGSVHKSGTRYAWMPGLSPAEVALAAFPGAVLDIFTNNTSTYDPIPTESLWDKDTPPTKYPCPISVIRGAVLDRELVERLMRDEDTAVMLMQRMGARVDRVGQDFSCIRPGHGPDNIPSASLYIPKYTGRDGREPTGEVLYKEFHGDRGTVTLGQVYCEALNNQTFVCPEERERMKRQNPLWKWNDRCFGKGESWVWFVRALVELGGYQLPELSLDPMPLPTNAEAVHRVVYEWFQFLLCIRQVYEPGPLQAPFSWRFAARWCLNKKTNMERYVRWLFKHGCLFPVGKTSKGTNIIGLQPVERKAAKTVEGEDEASLAKRWLNKGTG